MDINALAKKIETSLPGALLEKATFGRPPVPSLWIEAARIRDVVAWIIKEAGPGQCMLEDLCVAQVEQALLLSYFLEFRGESGSHLPKVCVLRVSIDIPSPDSRPEIPSVVEVWTAAAPLEAYVGELFGIQFTDGPKSQNPLTMPAGWLGYPLRKSYVFPREFFGIAHGAEETGNA